MSEKLLFEDEREKLIIVNLVDYLFCGNRPYNFPQRWQDAEILIRYIKRDVWSISREQKELGERAIGFYSVRYIIDHLSKAEISEMLGEYFRGRGKVALASLLENRFHANVFDLITTQEKCLITKNDLKNWQNFDEIFKYPCWVDFDDEVFDLIVTKIHENKYNYEPVQYFLGATDDFKNYDKWFYLCKYILMTTGDFDTFYLAGDVFNIIWMTVDANDQETTKWFNDQVFEIFWSRVGSMSLLLGKKKLEPWRGEDAQKILDDSIGWLQSLPDLKKRLPKLPEDFPLSDADSDKPTFQDAMKKLRNVMRRKNPSVDEIGDALARAADMAWEPQDAVEFEEYVSNKLIPIVKDKNFLAFARHAIVHTMNTGKTVIRERKNIAKIREHLKDWPEEINDSKNQEFLPEIKLKDIVWAECEREDPYYESTSDLWRMWLKLSIDGKECHAYISDQRLYHRYHDMISKSKKFDLKSEIPQQYGKETFTRK